MPTLTDAPASFLPPSLSTRQAKDAGVDALVKIVRGNAVKAAIRDATVVFVYLLPAGNRKIARKLMRELAPGATTETYPTLPYPSKNPRATYSTPLNDPLFLEPSNKSEQTQARS